MAKNAPEPMEELENDPLVKMKPTDASAVIGQIDEILILAKSVAQEWSPIESMDLGKSGAKVKVPKTQNDLPMVQNKRLFLAITKVVVSCCELGEGITTPENETIILEIVETVEELNNEKCEAQGLKTSDEGRDKVCTETCPKLSLPKVSIPLKRIQ